MEILFTIFAGVAIPVLSMRFFIGLMLAVKPKEPGLMKRLLHDSAAPIITDTLIFRIILVGSIRSGSNTGEIFSYTLQRYTRSWGWEKQYEDW